MPPSTESNDEEKLNSKCAHHGEDDKSAVEPKHKRVKTMRNGTKNESSNFQRNKKLGLMKKNTAQDRLKRLRANIELQKKVIDEICTENKSITGDRLSSHKSFLAINKIEKGYQPESTCQSKYSADARLKKIRATFQKKLLNQNNDSKSITSQNEQQETKTSSTSSSKELDEAKECRTTRGKLRLNCDAIMDVDVNCDHTDGGNEVVDVLENSRCVLKSQLTSVANEISKLRRERAYLALHENFAPDVEMNLATPVGDLFIIVDTNIFLSHLSFIRKLLTCDIPPYTCPIIVVSWLVLQEIDYASKKNNAKLSSQAKAANIFIYECLKKKHPRIFGQSLEDFKQSFKNAVCIDDYILQYCLKFVSLNKNVILLTNDINLCNKSMVSHLSVFTKKEFQSNFALDDDLSL